MGRGASGSVCLARDVLSGRMYAVKRFRKADLRTSHGRSVLRYLERERDVLRLMATSERGDVPRGRWVIHMVTSGQTAHELHVVMPACLGGERRHARIRVRAHAGIRVRALWGEGGPPRAG